MLVQKGEVMRKRSLWPLILSVSLMAAGFLVSESYASEEAIKEGSIEANNGGIENNLESGDLSKKESPAPKADLSENSEKKSEQVKEEAGNATESLPKSVEGEEDSTNEENFKNEGEDKAGVSSKNLGQEALILVKKKIKD